MTRLNWDAAGSRFYEAGVDRGVLYVSQLGYAWPGLISVSESPTGGEARPYYLDGIRYANVASAEEFEAKIDAFSAPPEFYPCDGLSSIHNGLIVTQQPRKSFGFSYRTRIGNDVDGIDHGYKIHLVYNALAAPASRTQNTISDQSEAQVLSWGITTVPPDIVGYRPTAHFVIDTRMTSPEVLSSIEDLLYGTDDLQALLPTVDSLMTLFTTGVYDGGTPQPVAADILDGGAP